MRSIRISVLLPSIWCLIGLLAAGTTSAGEEEGTTVLTGILSRSQVESALPDWVVAEIEAEPDAEAIAALQFVPGDLEVKVFLGTWCSDSRRELARLWRALDEAGGEVPFRLHYVGVERGLEEPAELVRGQDLRYVPTFIVYEGEAELGRIVEVSPNGIEKDLLALLDGTARGLITAREDLLAEATATRTVRP